MFNCTYDHNVIIAKHDNNACLCSQMSSYEECYVVIMPMCFLACFCAFFVTFYLKSPQIVRTRINDAFLMITCYTPKSTNEMNHIEKNQRKIKIDIVCDVMRT